jgi:hypothetical protein
MLAMFAAVTGAAVGLFMLSGVVQVQSRGIIVQNTQKFALHFNPDLK